MTLPLCQAQSAGKGAAGPPPPESGRVRLSGYHPCPESLKAALSQELPCITACPMPGAGRAHPPKSILKTF